MRWRSVVLVSLVLALLVLPAFGAQPTQKAPKTEVSYPVAVASSPAFRDLPVDNTEVTMGTSPNRVIPNPQLNKTGATSAPEAPFDVDAALQYKHGNAPAPSPLISFDGVNNLASVAPPDTQGDIGPDHYVQWVNLHLAAWSINRTAWTATPAFGPVAGNTIWAGLGGQCASDNDGDPIVLWDRFRSRWVISQFSLGSGAKTAIAVSKTADPTGAWWLYCYDYSPTTMNDYPKFGVWPDGYYYTCNQFANFSSWGGAGLCVFEADKMINGDATARQLKIDLGAVSLNYGGILPAHFEGTNAPPAGSGYFVEVDDSSWMSPPLAQDSISLWKAHVNWTTGTFTVGVGGLPDLTIPVTNFTPLCVGNRNCIPQPGTTQRVDAIADRGMYRLQYRNFGTYEAMTFNMTVDSGSAVAGVRWFELRKDGGHPDWYLYQEGTYAPADGKHRWMGSAGQDHMGDLCVGYSLSDGTATYPSVAYAGRLAGDPLGTLPQSEVILHSGAASQTGVNRWGDYSSMSIDPVDDCTFWYTQEYTTGGWNWATRIGAFKFGGCSIGPTGTLNGTVYDALTIAPIAGATVTAVGTVTVATTTGPTGAYSMTLPVDTYNVTASAFGFNPSTVNGIAIADGVTITQSFGLAAAGSHTINFHVEDGSTGWPLYSRIDVTGDMGYPGASFWTDPVTGITGPLPFVDGVTYTVNAVPWVPGYGPLPPATLPPLTTNYGVYWSFSADMAACTAPGYTQPTLLDEPFTATTMPAGWSVVNNGGTCNWAFNNPGGRTNLTGGTGNFAVADSDDCGSGTTMNTELRTPVINATGVAVVTLQFKYDYNNLGDTADVDVSVNGAAGPWTNVWRRTASDRGPKTATIDISAIAANQANVMIRFHYYNAGWDWWWEVDDVKVTGSCSAPATGGIIVGQVNDANTAGPVTGATVTNAVTTKVVTAQATPDPAVGDAFYCAFANTGDGLDAAMALYGSDSTTAGAFPSSRILVHDFSLAAGRLAATPPSLSYWAPTNGTGSQTLALDNVGASPVTWTVKELPGHPAAPSGNLFACMAPLGPTKMQWMEAKAQGKARDRHKQDGSETPVALAPASSNSGRAPTVNRPEPAVAQSLKALLPLGTTAYAIDVYPANGTVVSFDCAVPGTFTGHGDAGITLFAGDFVMGDTTKLYALNYDTNQLVTVDTATAAVTVIGAATPNSGESWSGMAAANTGEVYVCSTSCSSSTLYTIDITTGAVTPIGTVTNAPCLIDIAIDSSGNLYGEDIIADNLVSIDRATGAGTIIGSTGFNANYAQGMDFDDATNTLYLAAYNNGTFQGELRTCNTTTGASTLVGAFPGGDEVDCLAFTSFTPSDIPWLDETPKSGAVVAGGSQDVTVDYDATGLATGAYLATLAFSNDTPYGTLNVPVTFTVWEPVAAGAPLSGQAPLAVAFTGTITNPMGVYTYDWDFGDGSPHGTTLSPTHTYNVGGTFTVTFSATDSFGHTASDNHLVVTVTAPAAPVVYNFYDDAGRSRLCVNRITGAYSWEILTGPGAPNIYTGTATIVNGGTKIYSKAGDPNYLNCTYDPIKKRASGYYNVAAGPYYSRLTDLNTTNNPAGCY